MNNKAVYKMFLGVKEDINKLLTFHALIKKLLSQPQPTISRLVKQC